MVVVCPSFVTQVVSAVARSPKADVAAVELIVVPVVGVTNEAAPPGYEYVPLPLKGGIAASYASEAHCTPVFDCIVTSVRLTAVKYVVLRLQHGMALSHSP